MYCLLFLQSISIDRRPLHHLVVMQTVHGLPGHLNFVLTPCVNFMIIRSHGASKILAAFLDLNHGVNEHAGILECIIQALATDWSRKTSLISSALYEGALLRM